MEIVELLERAKKQLSDTTGLKPVSVTRVIRDETGWHVGLELLEMSRIPDSTDVLGNYDVLLGEDGSMLSFARRCTRLRGEPVGEEGQ
ncbi:MAG: gas vesicle protein GvpO [Chloroflexota bacterium]